MTGDRRGGGLSAAAPLLMVLTLGIVMAFPQIALWLPQTFS